MKNLNVLLLSFLFLFVYSLSLQAQGDDPTVPNFLFLFGQVDVSSQTTITHTLTAQGTYWEYDDGELPISTDSELEEANAVITGSTTPEPSYTGSGVWKGFIFPWIIAPYEYTDDIAYGFYKVTNSYNNDYFYIDMRDCKYAGRQTSICTYYNPDFFIKFYKNQNVFKWRRGLSVWQSIPLGQVLNVWDIANNGTPPTTSSFEYFWENALVLVNNGNNHPLLVWGPYPDDGFSVQYYKVYKKKGTSNFSIVQTTTELTWIDTEETIITGPPQANEGVCYYKVTAVGWLQKESIETGYTNTVDTRVEGDPQEKIGYKSGNNPLVEFALYQNFPNPFNPVTTISYSIANDGLVTLKVFDILGIEIATLVNEYKTMGNYQTKFNAKEIPSGIYFYTLTAGKFTSTKKLILLK